MFSESKEQQELREQVKKFAEDVIAPRAQEIDERDEFPQDVWKRMGEEPYRYPGFFIPEEYDGKPRSLPDACIITEEITASGRSPICTALLEVVSLGTQSIIQGGNEEQKKKYIPKVARGESLCAFSLTEPGTGSDASNIQTVAKKEGDEYVINGRKRYTSFAHQSEYIVLFAKTDPEKGARGVSAFIVDKDAPGFEIEERIKCMGLKGHQDEELKLDDCRVPEENLVGEEGKGFYYAMKTLDETRTTLTGGFIGLARAALEESLKYAKKRSSFGSKLGEKQRFFMELAEVESKIEAARLLNFRAGEMSEEGKGHTVETAMAKIRATEAMLEATNLAVEIHGGFGCTKRHPVERFYRDARIWSFAQGTPDVMKIITARELLDMPKLI